MLRDRGSKFPPSQGAERVVERFALFALCRTAEQLLVCCDCEIQRVVIMFGASKCSRIVGNVGAREVVCRKSLGHLLPSPKPRARIGFGQCPEVPASPVRGIGCDCTRR